MTHRLLAEVTRGMTTRRWIAEIPAQAIATRTLTPIQGCPATLLPEAEARRDVAIHVVALNGLLYIEDGNHRYWRARDAGRAWMLARVFQIPESGTA